MNEDKIFRMYVFNQEIEDVDPMEYFYDDGDWIYMIEQKCAEWVLKNG
jgi:hypothetical protein